MYALQVLIAAGDVVKLTVLRQGLHIVQLENRPIHQTSSLKVDVVGSIRCRKDFRRNVLAFQLLQMCWLRVAR